MPERSTWDVDARQAFAGARDPARLEAAVVKFHRRVDEVIDVSIGAHAVKIACTRGCSFCCSIQVQVLPHETFTLAAWLRRHFSADRIGEVMSRLRDNAAKTRAMGDEARKRSNLACALLGDDGACTAYEARPAQCRRFHSTQLEVCKASYADPADDSVKSPAHPAVTHNVDVIITQTQHVVRDEGLDATPADMNLALLDALDNAKAWRRWRDGKKPFVNPAPKGPA